MSDITPGSSGPQSHLGEPASFHQRVAPRGGTAEIRSARNTDLDQTTELKGKAGLQYNLPGEALLEELGPPPLDFAIVRETTPLLTKKIIMNPIGFSSELYAVSFSYYVLFILFSG